MAKRTRPGTCCLCAVQRELTFEHVPPQAAGNNSRVSIVTGFEAIELPPGVVEDGDYQQRGMGAYTLCGPCNSSTGGWYGGSFIDWYHGGRGVLLATKGRYTAPNSATIYPLRISKQILTMFCSVRGAELVQLHPDVRSFLLDKEKSGMPTGIRIFVHYAVGTVYRYTAYGTHLKLDGMKTTQLSEFVFPPFGYMLTYDGSAAPSSGPVEITSWANFGYDETASVDMNLPLLCTLSPIAGDYQTPEELMATKAENDRIIAELEERLAAKRP